MIYFGKYFTDVRVCVLPFSVSQCPYITYDICIHYVHNTYIILFHIHAFILHTNSCQWVKPNIFISDDKKKKKTNHEQEYELRKNIDGEKERERVGQEKGRPKVKKWIVCLNLSTPFSICTEFTKVFFSLCTIYMQTAK